METSPAISQATMPVVSTFNGLREISLALGGLENSTQNFNKKKHLIPYYIQKIEYAITLASRAAEKDEMRIKNLQRSLSKTENQLTAAKKTIAALRAIHHIQDNTDIFSTTENMSPRSSPDTPPTSPFKENSSEDTKNLFEISPTINISPNHNAAGTTKRELFPKQTTSAHNSDQQSIGSDDLTIEQFISDEELAQMEIPAGTPTNTVISTTCQTMSTTSVPDKTTNSNEPQKPFTDTAVKDSTMSKNTTSNPVSSHSRNKDTTDISMTKPAIKPTKFTYCAEKAQKRKVPSSAPAGGSKPKKT
jgi:hypothetical protein